AWVMTPCNCLIWVRQLHGVMTHAITVCQATTPADMAAFISLPYDLYRGDSSWRPPLRLLERDRFNPDKNPGLERLDLIYWLAKSGDKIVGRCASFLNHVHLETHGDETGHFGFLDTDSGYPEAIPALLKASEDWLRAKGMKHIGGPYNFSVNEECGMLIDGFDTPQMMLMPHGRPDYPAAMEANGFSKAMDTFAFLGNTVDGYPRPPIVQKMQAYVEKSSSLTIRPMKSDAFEDEITLAMDIFNDAWSNNWNYVPYSDAQVQHMANDLKALIEPAGFWFGEVDGVAKGFVLMLPNVNEAVRDLDGRLLPLGWAKFLWRLKVSGVKSARIPLMGIRKDIQKKRSGSALMLSLFETCYGAMRPKGIHDVEMSWILEPNIDVQNMIRLSTADIYKTYRLYTKPL
ncbi:MAG: N-acetyltransferase, partial [Pseudomonadota bacterium]